jgi:hypothetical protein
MAKDLGAGAISVGYRPSLTAILPPLSRGAGEGGRRPGEGRSPGFGPARQWPHLSGPQHRDLRVEHGEILLPLRILRREFCQPRHDVLALAQIVASLCLVTRLLVRVSELAKAQREIMPR